MSFKTILAIVLTIFLTMLMVQNTGEAAFTILFIPVVIPKLAMLTAVSGSAFILGILVSRPGRRKSGQRYAANEDDDEDDDDYTPPGRRSDTLSDEDRDYIS